MQDGHQTEAYMEALSSHPEIKKYITEPVYGGAVPRGGPEKGVGLITWFLIAPDDANLNTIKIIFQSALTVLKTTDAHEEFATLDVAVATRLASGELERHAWLTTPSECLDAAVSELSRNFQTRRLSKAFSWNFYHDF